MKMRGENRNTWRETRHSAASFTTKPTLTVLRSTDRWPITSLTARSMYFGSEIIRHDGSSENVRITVEAWQVILDTKTDSRHKNTPFVKRCLWVKNYRQDALGRREHVSLIVHSAVHLTTNTQPLLKRILHTVRSSASSLNFQYYPLVSSRP
jgi:hypothetical protein